MIPDLENTPTAADLGAFRLWRHVAKARLLEEASAGFSVEPDELEPAWQAFCQKNKVDSVTSLPIPGEFLGCPPDRLKPAVERELRIAKWCQALFEPQAREHYERRKPALDRIVYSLLRVKDAGLARELWFRIKEGEASFADLSPKYAGGHEVYTAGIVGPVAIAAMHPALAAYLKPARPGELLKPCAIAEWFVVARVDHHLPAEFDEPMKAQMIEELMQHWLEERAHGIPTA